MTPIRSGILAWLGVCLGTLTLAAAAGGEESFRHDFRQSAPPPGIFRYVGKDPQDHIRPDATGLKIILPASEKKQKFPQTGVKFNPILEGDFEITLGYEVIKLQQPTTGYGSGVSIFIQTESPRKEAATLAALLPVSGDMRFVTSRHTTGDDGKRAHRSKATPVRDEGRVGTLQLVRRGKDLHYLAATSKESAPRELAVFELGAEPVTVVRLVADPGGSNTGLEVCLKEFTVKADKLTTESERLARSSASAWWLAGAGVVFAVAAGGVFFLWRRFNRADD